MKKFLLFLSFLLMSIGMFGETITFKVYQSGSSSTTYVTTETQQTSGSYNYKMCNWNPSNGLTRGNQSNVDNNFYIYNTTAIPGNITKIQINVKSGTYTYSNKIYYVLSTSSCKSSSGGTTFSSNTANVTGSNTFFCIYFKNGATSGTSCLNSITITYTPTTSYTIAAQSNNNSYGTVSLDNKVITATSNSGYRIDDDNPYDISPSGSATVVRGTGVNINKFTVTPSANTTVTINFEPIPIYTVTFINSDTIYKQRENIKEDSTITDFPTEIEPNDACKKNRWEFIGWTKNGTSTINSLKVTKNDTLYALYRILISGGVEYVTDTLSYDFIGNSAGYGTASYSEFNDKQQTSNAIYQGNTSGGWTFSNNPPGPTIQIRVGDGTSKRAGIVTSQSGGNLYKVKVIWNSKSENTTHSIWIFESDTIIDPLNSMFVGSHEHKSIPYSNTGGEVELDGGLHIGIRSDAGTIYIDSIYITWVSGTLEYEYSTNPKCFETNISVAEWHKDYVEFDIGNYDSIHTYNGPMNSCDSIRIKITNDNNEECIRWFQVPVFAGVNTIIDNLDCDVVILKDSTLTINSNISNNNVYVYPDGTLIINKNKTYTVNSLTLRRDNNDVPQFLYNGTLKVNDGMFFEMRSNNEDWRWLTLPDSIRISEISDKPEVLLKYYDGNERAKNGRGGWKLLNKDTISGFGTIFGVNIDTDEKRIYKFRLDTNILSQEKSLANKHIKVKKFFYSNKPTNDLGWNLVGNPFMTTYNVNTLFGVIFESDSLVKEIVNGQWTGKWITEEKDLRYIVVPSDKQELHIIDAGGYEQICLLDGYKLPPFTSFFIQAKDGGDLVFYHGQREANAPSRKTTINENKESFLRICIGSIKTGCYISNKFTDLYEIGDDMESLYSTYQLINGYKLLYSAVNDSIIEHGIKIYTPAGNLYLDDKTNVEDFVEIYALYDGDWIDLLHGQTLDVNGEFILFAKRKNQETIPTDIDIIKDNNEIIKFMHNNNLYIKKNNHIFNILGGVIK